MERELSRFSRSHQPTSLQAWISDNKPPNANKEPLQQIQASLPETKDTDKRQKAVLDPREKPPTKDNNHITEKEYGPGNKSSANLGQDEKEQTKEDLGAPNKDDHLAPVVEVLAAVKEVIKEPDHPEETQPQIECIKDPPISFGEDLVNVTWVDVDDEPWEHGSYVGGPYTE